MFIAKQGGDMAILSSIFNMTSKAAQAVGYGISRMCSAIFSGVASAASYLFGLALDGVHDAVLISMGSRLVDEGKERVSRIKSPLNITINVILSFITYIPGFILGMTLFPLVWYTLENFYNYFDFTNDLVEQYAKSPGERKFAEFTYSGGPLKIFGLLGVILGITAGTLLWTIPRTFFLIVLPNTWAEVFNWAELGWYLPRADRDNFIERYASLSELEGNRSVLAKFLGYVPFGLVLSVFSFIFSLSLCTTLRVIANTFESMMRSIVFFVNKAFFDSEIYYDVGELFPDEQTKWEKFLGLAGFIIGSSVGIAVGNFIIATRVIINSCINFNKWFSNGFVLPVKDKANLHLISVHKFNLKFANVRSFVTSMNISWHEHLLGLPGHILAPVAFTVGFLAGSGLRIAAESWQSTLDVSNFMLSKMVFNKSDVELAPRKWYEPIIGILGYPVGLIIVTPFATLYTNYESAKRTLAFILSPIFPTNLEQDNRPLWAKALSAPGAIFGGTIGAIVRITVENAYMAYRTGQYLVQASLFDSVYAKSTLLERGEELSNYSKYLGFLGYIVGGVVVMPVFLTIIVGRLVFTNADSAKRAFATQVNSKLTENNKIDLSDDDRSDRLKTAGKLGYFLGFIAGKFGIFSIESVVCFEYSFKYIVRGALYQSDLEAAIQLNDLKNHSKFVGILGILSGGLIGLITGGVLLTGRIIYNTGVSISYVTVDMVRFVMSAKKLNDINNSTMLARFTGTDLSPEIQKDERQATSFYLGMLGIPLGGLLGTLAALTVGSLRIISQTLLTTYNETLFYTRYSLPSDTKYAIDKHFAADQDEVGKMLGTLGKVPGLALGLVGFVIGGSIRLVTNTFVSIYYDFLIGLDLPPVKSYSGLTYQDRRSLPDRILGIPGYIIGLPVGLMAYLGHITVRVVYESARTGYSDAKSIALWSMGTRDKFLLGNSDINAETSSQARTFGEKHGFGFLGHIIGVTVGPVISSIVFIVRYVIHQWDSLKVGFDKFIDVSRIDKKLDILRNSNHMIIRHINRVQLPFGMGETGDSI